MLKNKLYMGILVGLLFGICITMPLKGAGNIMVLSAGDSIVEGTVWQVLDNDTVTLLDESWNVSIGTNETTEYRLFVNGSANVTGDILAGGYVNASYFVGDGSGIFGVPGAGLWTRVGTTIFTNTSGDSVQVNGSDGDILVNNSNITSTGTLTLGSDGNIPLCLGVHRIMYPYTDLMVSLGNDTNRFKDLFLGGNATIDGHINATSMNLTHNAGIRTANFWCEESAALDSGTDGGLQFSYGDGATGAWGPTQPWAGHITAMSMTVDTDTSTEGFCLVNMAINGVSAAGEYFIGNPGAANGGNSTVFGTPLPFSAGDKLTAITTQNGDGTTTDVVISFWVVYS